MYAYSQTWGLGGPRRWHLALMLLIFHLALLFLLSCPICKVVILIICCWKQTTSKQWLQTIKIIYLHMNLKFGPGLARQFAFIPRGISWGGWKDNWGQVQWGSSETKSLGVNSEDLVVLPSLPATLLLTLLPNSTCVEQHVFPRSCHTQPSPGLRQACLSLPFLN